MLEGALIKSGTSAGDLPENRVRADGHEDWFM
jgi:hypothetical protein